MAFTLNKVVPWGRSFDEYVAMFDLSVKDLESRVLGCADGPASFNAQMYEQGHRVISIDPIYQYSVEQIRARIEATFPTIMEQLEANRGDYIWKTIPSPEMLGQLRMTTMRKFMADFEQGKREGRYLSHALPSLPFQDEVFDLALCSHFLFLYSEQLSADFHCQAIQEMLRVAKEARIFPLLTLGRQPSPHLETVYEFLRKSGLNFEVLKVNYEFQRGGNKMLRVWLK